MKYIKSILIVVLVLNVVGFLTAHFMQTISFLLYQNSELISKLGLYGLANGEVVVMFFGIPYTNIALIIDVLVYILVFLNLIVITIIIFSKNIFGSYKKRKLD